MSDVELRSSLTTTQALATTMIKTSDEYTAKVAAIDATAPGAAAQISAIVSERDAWRSQANSEMAASGAVTNAIIKSLPADEQAAAVALTNSTVRITNSYFSTARDAFNNAKTAKNAEITAATPEATVKTPAATNPSATEADTKSKYAETTGTVPVVPDTSYDKAEAARLAKTVSPTGGGRSSAAFSATDPRRLDKPSSEPKKVSPAIPSMGSKDHRVRLRIPASYLVGQAAGPNNELQKNDGIVFPYTPSISQDYKANYNSVAITHSNFNQYFYKSSAAGEISLTAKFTVQNEMEAGIYLSVIHLLRALTKMKTGNDQNAGSPPPICRLMAYGQYGLDNTPVAISSVGIEYPDNVDYFETGNALVMYGANTVPVLATIKLTLIPIYSRNEQLKFSVGGWLTDNFRTKGYL